jgi:hypothetical protein
MNQTVLNVSFPLDDDGFFRRECPLCCREFKVLLTKEEMSDVIQFGLDSYMLESEAEATNESDNEEEASQLTCPYCGQQANRESWWTQEQITYLHVVFQNIVAEIVNKEFIRPLKGLSRRHSSGPITLKFTGKEMEQEEPWISPEVNDMEEFNLPCCQRKIKIQEGWTSVVHCFFCGFPYESEEIET